MRDQFPYRKDFADGRFAYVVELTYGRGRINLSKVNDQHWISDSW
jgi:hypothetical protein